jgi:hypothetical protein
MPVIVAILLMILLVVPVEAASIRHIDATIAENGDASIVAGYSLNWAEQVFVYPAAVPLLAGVTGKNIQVHSVSPSETQVTVLHLAKVVNTPGATTYKTPAFALSDARKKLDAFWFGDMVTLDGSSGSLTFRYPDGAIIEYQDLTSIPPTEHVVYHP